MVDNISYDFLKGATVDYVEELIRAAFIVSNSSCMLLINFYICGGCVFVNSIEVKKPGAFDLDGKWISKFLRCHSASYEILFHAFSIWFGLDYTLFFHQGCRQVVGGGVEITTHTGKLIIVFYHWYKISKDICLLKFLVWKILMSFI